MHQIPLFLWPDEQFCALQCGFGAQGRGLGFTSGNRLRALQTPVKTGNPEFGEIMNMRIISIIAVTALTLSFAACNKKASECKTIDDMYTQVAKKPAAETGKGKEFDAAKAKAEAEEADQMAAKHAQLTLKTPELQKISADLMAAHKGMADAYRKLGGVSDKPEEAANSLKNATEGSELMGKSADALMKSAEELQKFCNAN